MSSSVLSIPLGNSGCLRRLTPQKLLTSLCDAQGGPKKEHFNRSRFRAANLASVNTAQGTLMG